VTAFSFLCFFNIKKLTACQFQPKIMVPTTHVLNLSGIKAVSLSSRLLLFILTYLTPAPPGSAPPSVGDSVPPPPPLPAMPPPGRPKFTAGAAIGSGSPQLGGRGPRPNHHHQSTFSPRGGAPLLQKAESMTLEAVRGIGEPNNFFHGEYSDTLT
jgi:hypothetical protein